MKRHIYLAQKPLRASYESTPALATVTDHARTLGTAPHDPFRTRVEPMDGCGVEVPIGTHAALGAPHDAPTPGDMLCAALAACQDSAFRIVASLLEQVARTLIEQDMADTLLRGCAGPARHCERLQTGLGVSVTEPTQAAGTQALGTVLLRADIQTRITG